MKFEFVERINHIENKPYFHRKLAQVVSQTGETSPVKVVEKQNLKTSFEPAPISTEETTKLKGATVKEVRFAEETDKLISTYTFYDEISSSCCNQPKDEEDT